MNLPQTLTLPLSQSGSKELAYSDATFFPIDGQLFGNEGNPHNFHFRASPSARIRRIRPGAGRFGGGRDRL